MDAGQLTVPRASVHFCALTYTSGVRFNYFGLRAHTYRHAADAGRRALGYEMNEQMNE